MKPEKYCQKIVKKSGSNFYYSFFFLPTRKRRAIYAVYAFSRTIDDIVDEGDDAAEKERLLAFWRTEIDSAYNGSSEHPLTKEIAYAAREFDIPKEYFFEHLNGVIQDMTQSRYAAFEDLKIYCYRVASIVGLICLKIFGVDDTLENREAAVNLGLAFQMTNILRDMASDAERGRVYIPEEDLIKFRLTTSDVFKKKYSEEFRLLMEFEWKRADEFFRRAAVGFDKKSWKKLLPAAVMASIYYRILERIKEEDYNVFKGKISIGGAEKIKLVAETVFLGKGLWQKRL